MKTLGIILGIIGLFGLFFPLMRILEPEDAAKLEISSISDARALCDSWLGELGKGLNPKAGVSCGRIEFLYFASIGFIIIGTIIFVAGLIIKEVKDQNKSPETFLEPEIKMLNTHHCKHCGEQLGEEDTYCKACGRELRRTHHL